MVVDVFRKESIQQRKLRRVMKETRVL